MKQKTQSQWPIRSFRREIVPFSLLLLFLIASVTFSNNSSCREFSFFESAINAEVSPTQRIANVIASSDYVDWQYKTKEQAAFDFQIYKDNVLLNKTIQNPIQ